MARRIGNAEAVARFIQHQRGARNLSERTITSRSVTLGLLVRHLDRRSLWSATPGDIEDMLASRGRIVARTRAQHLSNLAAFYRWAVRSGHTPTDPTIHMDRPKLPKSVPRPIRDDDLEMALELADDRMRLWLLLGAYEGMRVAEIARLAREDIMETWYPPVILVHGKGSKERLVPLHAKVWEAMRIYGLPRSGHLFPGRFADHLHPATVSKAISRFLRNMNVEATEHMARHWFGTNTYRQSKDLLLVGSLMGHAKPETTMGYALWDGSEAAPVVNALDVTRHRHVARDPGPTTTAW